MNNAYINEKDEAFIRSGLAKSAFSEKIYEELPWSYYMPYITEVQKLTRSLAHVLPKVYQAHDSFLMFYKPYSLVHLSLKKTNKASPVWHTVISEAIHNNDFYDVNKFTSGSMELSILASYQFLSTLFKTKEGKDLEDVQEKIKKLYEAKGAKPDPQQIKQELQDYWEKMQNTINKVIGDIKVTVEEYGKLRKDLETALMLPIGTPGGTDFVKDTLNVVQFLKEPEEFRKRVRLLKYARIFTSRFTAMLPTTFAHEQAVSVFGGINGVGKMNSYTVLGDVLPYEIALLSTNSPVARAIFAVKYVSQQLMAYQHATAMKPIVFLDKSGSMAENYSAEFIPKISVASGLAFAMHRKFDAPIYLFDTDIVAVKPKDIVQMLLTIKADGGTNIDPVLEEIMRIGKKEYIYIVISDGITSADDDVLEKFKKTGLASNTKLILIPPARAEFNWVYLLKQYNNVQYANDIATFEKAVKKALG
ncbi:MAG: hypothetical protein JHC26_04850 [Thermofilum sp.]|jgi:uncharacterized protein with von Willebrand factor type A (vWA) domain|uniref:vWA domain-containing protein n=1 Tax=Thermofilum sp. TaxID=1961369 RepID=UPI002586E6F1|nr:hypothetical protein [Thermofilum sp.]MCI4408397.1 hypothetical protein [Thermofilum sp.]